MNEKTTPGQGAIASSASGRTSHIAKDADTVWFLAGRLSPEGPLQYIPVDSEQFTVGRSAACSLCIASSRVSSLHAELKCTGRCLALCDPGSTNGTFVNGARVDGSVTLEPDDLILFADVPFRVMQHTVQRNAVTAQADVIDQAIMLVHFDRLMTERAVIPHYQPIVDLCDDGVIAFEALARSNISELQTPGQMFSAAAQLGLEMELSQMMRFKAVQETSAFRTPPHLFLNTHPAELGRPGLVESMRAIRELKESQPITLEIHEKAITNCSDMIKLQVRLRELDISLAFDDFGAGQSRILELFDVHPEYLKFDMSLIRDIHTASDERQRLVASLVQAAQEVGAVPLAEGIECAAERDTCKQLGFRLAQGFFFGRPVPLTGTPSNHRLPSDGFPTFDGRPHTAACEQSV